MRLLKILAVIGAAIVLAKIFVFPDYRYRFRLTIEFDTPDGVKSASGVHEVVRKDVRWILIAQGQYEVHFHGDAIFLDLGRGKHVIALVTHGRWGEGDRMPSMGLQAYLPDAIFNDSSSWSRLSSLGGPRELQSSLVPTLTTFTTIADPTSARILDPYDPSSTMELLGAGYGFRRATIELIHGIWPLDVFGISGEPITRGITAHLPWWNLPGRPAHQAHMAMKQGVRTGSAPAEALFTRR